MLSETVFVELVAKSVGDALGDENKPDVLVLKHFENGRSGFLRRLDDHAVDPGEAEAAHSYYVTDYLDFHVFLFEKDHEGDDRSVKADTFRKAEEDQGTAHQFGTFRDGAQSGGADDGDSRAAGDGA